MECRDPIERLSNMKQIITIIAAMTSLVLSASRLAAQEQPLRLGLDEAVARATELNEDVLVARAEAARTAGQVREVRAQSLPQLTADLGFTRNIQTPVIFFNTPDGVQQISIGESNDLMMGLSLSQPLLDFSLGPARRASRLAAEASEASVEASRTAVTLQAKLDYFTVLLDRRLLEVQEKALEQAQARLRQVEAFHRAGTGSDFDLLTAQVEVDNIRPRLIEARNRLELDLNNLKRTIDIPLDRRVELSDSLAGPAPQDSFALEDAVARALENRSDLRVQRTTVALQNENLAAERRGLLPTLNLQAQLTRRATSASLIPPERNFIQSTTVGLVLEFPIFDGMARSGRIQQAEAALERERFRLQRSLMSVRLGVQQALQALRAAREQVDASQGTVRRAEEALRIAQVRFANGLSTQVEVNDAELAVTEARTNQASARYAYSVARAQLQAAMGER